MIYNRRSLFFLFVGRSIEKKERKKQLFWSGGSGGGGVDVVTMDLQRSFYIFVRVISIDLQVQPSTSNTIEFGQGILTYILVGGSITYRLPLDKLALLA